MAKLTKEEAAQLEALQKRAEEPDDDFTLLVEDDQGRKTHLRGSLARAWAKRNGFEELTEDDDGGGDGDGKGDPPDDKKPPSTHKFFR